MDKDINETVLDVSQRQRRAQSLRRNMAKMERAKELAKKRLAPNETIKKRAYAQARQIVRRRVAGARGAEYEKLGTAEKIAIDRAIEGKQKLIKKLANKLIPRVKSAEQKRLATFMKGHALTNHGATEGSGQSSVNERFEKNFIKKTDIDNDAPANGTLMPGNKDVIQYDKFDDEKNANTNAYKAIAKKALKSKVSEDLLGAVYDRGLLLWNESFGLSQQQYAFARVNSFINGGRSLNEDSDLIESNNTPYVKPHIEKGSTQQSGWKASNKHGKVKYFGMDFKKSANKHAGIEESNRSSIQNVNRDKTPHTPTNDASRSIDSKQNVERDSTPHTPSNDADKPTSTSSAAPRQQQVKKKVLESINSAFSEQVKVADKAPVVIPTHKDSHGNVIPAKTVMKLKQKAIIKSGDVHNGDRND